MNYQTIKTMARPEVIVAMAAAIWGLFWVPLRVFESQGMAPAWVILSQFVAPLVFLAPFAMRRFLLRRPTGIGRYGTGLLVGGAVVMYCEGLLITNVVRALILFYAMPAWGTLVEVGLMGRRFTLWRGLSLALGLSGLATILGLGASFTSAINIGDLMALVSGILFTFGAMQVRQASDIEVFEQVFAFFFFGTMTALAFSLVPLTAPGRPPAMEKIVALAPWIVLMAVGILIPAMWGLYWGSRFVDPGRLGILLQLEAVVGIGSAALFAGEPFGAREAVGAALVVSAGVVEVFGNAGKEVADGHQPAC